MVRTRSLLIQLGRTSLFIYWIHVELVYGLISRPWHRRLNLQQAVVAYVAFCGLMLACSIAKERIVRDFVRPRTAAAPGRAQCGSGADTLTAVRRMTS